MGTGGLGVVLVFAEGNDAGAGRVVFGDGGAGGRVELGYFVFVGGGDPQVAAAQGDAAGVYGVGLGFKEDFAALVVEAVDFVVGLVDAPEAVGGGLEAVGVGAGAFEEDFGFGDFYGHEGSPFFGWLVGQY